MSIEPASLSPERITFLINDIKKKKELRSINLELVREELFHYLNQNHSAAQFLISSFNTKSEKYKQTIKKVRANLRRKYSLFRSGKKIDNPIKRLIHSRSLKEPETILEILKTNASTRERISFYNELYQKIFKIARKPQIILDLGCGLNPFSISFMKLTRMQYYTYDIDEEEIRNLNLFFDFLKKKNKNIGGKAEIRDITKNENITNLPSADICFLFKVTDILDQGKGHKKTEELLKIIPVKYLIISFPRVTMSGKRMNAPRRKWMEWLCQRLGYKYTLLEFPTEIFYVVEK